MCVCVCVCGTCVPAARERALSEAIGHPARCKPAGGSSDRSTPLACHLSCPGLCACDLRCLVNGQRVSEAHCPPALRKLPLKAQLLRAQQAARKGAKRAAPTGGADSTPDRPTGSPGSILLKTDRLVGVALKVRLPRLRRSDTAHHIEAQSSSGDYPSPKLMVRETSDLSSLGPEACQALHKPALWLQAPKKRARQAEKRAEDAGPAPRPQPSARLTIVSRVSPLDPALTHTAAAAKLQLQVQARRCARRCR